MNPIEGTLVRLYDAHTQEAAYWLRYDGGKSVQICREWLDGKVWLPHYADKRVRAWGLTVFGKMKLEKIEKI